MAKRIPLHQIDAFADAVFKGNPAAVCPLERWLDDAEMQAIAEENNLAETAFFVPRAGGDAAAAGDREYDLRWFTPAREVDLCGHATLASAYLIYAKLAPAARRLRFHTLSGPLDVVREGGRLVMDFPAFPPAPREASPSLRAALGRAPKEALFGGNMDVAVLGDASEVRALAPDLGRVAGLDGIGLIVTAPGGDCDFVSRFFAPKLGIPEDPVTGAAHCVLTPYWAQRLGKTSMRARQLSKRGGELFVEHRGERVRIGGRAATYLEGTITL
jgi:PhzF family phenazine biosynthesis protein